MALVIRHLARWLAFQLGEIDRPVDCPPARITVFSGRSRSAA
jgi:hypothetical protein